MRSTTKDAATGKPAPYCGFYTEAQIREVVAYAAARHVEVVPEVDIPGHATAAIAAYPQLGVSGQPIAVSNEWGVNVNLFNADEATKRFLEDVMAQVARLFPGKFVHVGGDEAVKDQWKASPKMQARIRALGVDGEEGLQAWMVARLERALAAHGKRLLGWDEILMGELPPSATVMSWRGIEGGIEAAKKGHDVVMAPSDVLYLDYLQTDKARAALRSHLVLPYQDGIALAAKDQQRRDTVFDEATASAAKAPAAPPIAAPGASYAAASAIAPTSERTAIARAAMDNRNAANAKLSAAANAGSAASRAAASYTVAKGDTLSTIAAKHGVSVADLRSWNHLKNDNIRLGQSLQVSNN